MTTSRNVPSVHDAPPLRTDADVLARVEAMVGPACVASRLWLLLVDGDGHQSPVVTPIDGVPRRPDTLLDGLGQVIRGVADQLVTPAGAGSVVLVRERLGSSGVTGDDRAWERGLTGVCDRVGVAVRGVFVSTPCGVLRLR